MKRLAWVAVLLAATPLLGQGIGDRNATHLRNLLIDSALTDPWGGQDSVLG